MEYSRVLVFAVAQFTCKDILRAPDILSPYIGYNKKLLRHYRKSCASNAVLLSCEKFIYEGFTDLYIGATLLTFLYHGKLFCAFLDNNNASITIEQKKSCSTVRLAHLGFVNIRSGYLFEGTTNNRILPFVNKAILCTGCTPVMSVT